MPALEPLTALPDPRHHAMAPPAEPKAPAAPQGALKPATDSRQVLLSFHVFRDANGGLEGSLDWNQKELSSRMAFAFLQDLMERLEGAAKAV